MEFLAWTVINKESTQNICFSVGLGLVRGPGLRCFSSSKRTAVLLPNTMNSSPFGSAQIPFFVNNISWLLSYYYELFTPSRLDCLSELKLSATHSICILQIKSSARLKHIIGSKIFLRLLTRIRAILRLEIQEQINHVNWLLPWASPCPAQA